MKIKILGNGGALNDGLPYNSFIIDKKILVEMPPDVMLSLFREKIDVLSIEEIYISHFHGDHSFGFPYLALRLYRHELITKQNKKLKLYSPGRGKDYLIDLTEKAMSTGNPCVDWVKRNVKFINISNVPEIKLMNYTAALSRMDHFEENYGFVLSEGGKDLFTYISDTKWSESLESMLRKKSKIILLDLNGEPDDPNPIHLSEQDVVEKLLDLADPDAVFYGTHLKYQKKSGHNRIEYTRPGMEIEIE